MNEIKTNDINFEASIKRLDEISASLERENVSLEDALALYADKKAWGDLMKKAKKSDFTWGASAKKYLEIYNL